MNNTSELSRLLNPKTVAVIGGAAAEEALRQCQLLGFDGEIWPVNAKRSHLCGVPCFASVEQLPQAPDASFIAVSALATVQVVQQLRENGAGGAVCYAAGFAEAGPDGQALQRQLIAAAGNMAVIGPNCHGVINYLNGLALWPDQHGGSRAEQGIGLVSQSGNLAINITMQQRNLDISHVISIGNQAQTDITDCMKYFLTNPRVTAIGLHIESLNNIERFSRIALKALEQSIPVVALKSGRSALGAEVTMSHTNSLAGSDQLYDALFKRLGIARCYSVTQFIETLKLLSINGPLRGKRIGSLSCSGGDASQVADSAMTLDLEMPKLSGNVSSQLSEVLGSVVHISNPLDYHTFIWGDYDKLFTCFRAMLKNNFDCTLLVLDYPIVQGRYDALAGKSWETAERAWINAVSATAQSAVVVSTLPETLPQSARSRLVTAGIAPMQGLDDCLFAIRAAASIGAAQKTSARRLPVQVATASTGDLVTLTEWHSKQVLNKFGLSIPVGLRSRTDETGHSALTLGFPVALKLLSTVQAHKSETGAVKINLMDEQAVRAATQVMTAQGDDFLVEKMIENPLAELIIGISRDNTFGLTLLLGAGGTLVELINETVSLLFPVQRTDIAEALYSLRVMTLIQSWRGQAAGDIEEVIKAVEAVVAYANAHYQQIEELDVNPLIVTRDDAVAADAFIRTRLVTKGNSDGA